MELNSIKLIKNDQYHIELINSFSTNSLNNTGLTFSQELIDKLSILRRFRHYVFHGYSYKLEWDRLLLAIESIPELYKSFKFQLENYIKNLDK